MAPPDTALARIDDLAREIIELVRCRLAEGDSMAMIAAGFDLAFQKMGDADRDCAVLRAAVADLLLQQGGARDVR